MAFHHNTLRLGFIGGGFIAQVAHLNAFERVPEVTIAALAEPHDELRAAVAGRHRIARAYADYRDLLGDPEIDAVIVCLPRRAQAGVVADAVRAKRAVLSEKPMAMTLREAQSILATAEASQSRWTIGYMKRHDVGVRRFAGILRDLQESNAWGPLLDVDMRDFCATYGVPIPAHERRKSPRPVRFAEGDRVPDGLSPNLADAYEYTLNVGCHDINLIRSLFGDDLRPVSLRASQGGVQRATFDRSGVSITLTIGPVDVGYWDQELSATFAKGRAILKLPSPLARQESASIRLVHDGRTETMHVHSKDHVWCFEAQARSFAQSTMAGGEPLTSAGASIADIALVEALWRTADASQ